MMLERPSLRSRLERLDWHVIAGLSLLVAAALCGYELRLVFVFVDDSQHTLVGWLMTKGYRLYTDVWAQHFPLEYYLIEAALGIFGQSVGAVRLAVLAFNLSVFALLMWLTREYLVAGLAALTWSLAGPYYFGHMAIYYALSGPLLASILLVTLLLVLGELRPTRRVFAGLGLLFGAALLVNPASAAAIGVACLALVATRRNLARLALSLAIAATMLVAGGLLLWWHDELGGFYETAIRFNLDVYSQYSLAGPLPAGSIVQAALTGLYAPELAWMQRFPFLTFDRSVFELNAIDQWIFAGPMYRVVVGLAVLVCLLRRQWLAAALIYLFALALLIRAQDFFRAIPFVVACVVLAAWLAVRCAARLRRAAPWPLVVRAAAAFMLAWLVFRGAQLMLGSPERLSFEQNFGGYVAGSAALRRLVCERADVQMLYYPYDPAYYFYSGLMPSTPLNSLYPWNAYQLPATLQLLSTGKHLVHVNWSQTIWGYRVSDYAKSLQLFLQDHYVEKPGSNYFSPELAQVCP